MNIIIIIIIVIVIIIIIIIVIIIIIIVIISFIFLIILEMAANESAFFNRGLRGEQAYAKQAVSPCPAVGVFIQDGFNFPFCKVMLRGNQLSSWSQLRSANWVPAQPLYRLFFDDVFSIF